MLAVGYVKHCRFCIKEILCTAPIFPAALALPSLTLPWVQLWTAWTSTATLWAGAHRPALRRLLPATSPPTATTLARRCSGIRNRSANMAPAFEFWPFAVPLALVFVALGLLIYFNKDKQ